MNQESVNDLTIHQKLNNQNKFDPEKLGEEIEAKSIADINNAPQKDLDKAGQGKYDSNKKEKESLKKDITKMVHKGSTVLSFFFVGSGSVMLIVLSRVFHQETDKLHELNDIFQNPKARVVIGKDHGTQVIKKMKKIVHK